MLLSLLFLTMHVRILCISITGTAQRLLVILSNLWLTMTLILFQGWTCPDDTIVYNSTTLQVGEVDNLEPFLNGETNDTVTFTFEPNNEDAVPMTVILTTTNAASIEIYDQNGTLLAKVRDHCYFHTPSTVNWYCFNWQIILHCKYARYPNRTFTLSILFTVTWLHSHLSTISVSVLTSLGYVIYSLADSHSNRCRPAGK